MHFTAIAGALVALVPALASAQLQVHDVIVGANNTLTFTPNTLIANAGDIIRFTFSTKNHTATVTTFADPCNNVGNFTTGFMPVTAGAADLPTANFTVTSSAPAWFKCAQENPKSHCQAGMVLSVNPTEQKTAAQYQNNAVGNATTTGNGTTAGNGTTTSGNGTTTSGNGTTTSGNGTSTNTTGGANPAETTSGAIRFSNNAVLLTILSVIAGLTAL